MISSKQNTSGLIRTLREDAGFTDREIEFFMSLLSVIKIKKKEHYLMEGEVCKGPAYVNQGCFRRYIIDKHSKEITLNFALEDYWIGDLEGLFSKKPTIYFVQALEPSELFLLSRENFYRTYEELPKFKEFHENKIHRNHFKTLQRLSVTKSATPEEKYLRLMKEQPQLFQRIPLHYIASYLGIEPESLSRLRKRIIIHPSKS